MTTRKVWWDKDEGFPTIEEARENGIKSLKEKFPNREFNNFVFPYQYDYKGENGEQLYNVITKGDLVIPKEELDLYAKSALDLLENIFISKYIEYPTDNNDNYFKVTMLMDMENLPMAKNIEIEYKDEALILKTPMLEIDLIESKYKDSIINNVIERRNM